MPIYVPINVQKWVPRAGEPQKVTVQEFKDWLMKFDSDKDGRISRQELRDAIRSRGAWFMTTRRADRGMVTADVDRSGYIDESEIDFLLGFAERKMGFQFY